MPREEDDTCIDLCFIGRFPTWSGSGTSDAFVKALSIGLCGSLNLPVGSGKGRVSLLGDSMSLVDRKPLEP